MKKLAMLTFADIDNYGDTFFPYVFVEEMKKRLPGYTVDVLANQARKFGPVTCEEYNKKKLTQYNAVVLAGGEVVHDLDIGVWNSIYYPMTKGNLHFAPSDIVFNWTNLDIPFKAWFSIGVLPPQQSTWPKIINALNKLDYIALRGLVAKKIVENAMESHNPSLHIVPDMGWIFPHYIPTEDADKKRIECEAKVEGLFESPYLVFEAHMAAFPPAKQVASALMRIQEATGLRVIMLPLVRPWQDHQVMSYIMEASDGMLLLLHNNLSFLDMGTILTNAELYVGTSLHGAMTLLANGKPAGIIHPHSMTKYQDFLGMQMRLDFYENDWGQLEILVHKLLQERNDTNKMRQLKLYSEYMQLKLSDAFDELAIRIMENGLMDEQRRSFSSRLINKVKTLKI